MEGLTEKTKDFKIIRPKELEQQMQFGVWKNRPLDKQEYRSTETTKQYCFARISADQTIANSASQTKVQRASYTTNTDWMDTDNTYAITIQKSWMYMITATLSRNSNSSSYRNMQLYINGSNTIQSWGYRNTSAAASWASTSHTLSVVYDATKDDYIEIFCAQQSGGTLDLQATYCSLQVIEL